MSRLVPFTMHVRIVPSHGSGQLKSKRLENWRDMQKIATLMYESLESIVSIGEGSLCLAEPGGGQQQSFTGTRSGLSSMARGMAVKPQIGETPSQVMITGFIDDGDAGNIQNHPEYQRISGGEIYSGPAPAPWLQNPTSHVDSLVQALKTTVDDAFDADLPTNITFDIFRIDMSGVIYGDRGYTFP